MLRFILVFILGISSVLADSREEAITILNNLSRETSTVSKLDSASKLFLGLPYGHSGPLGEGPDGKYDQDPLYRFDTFDCTTYVETIMALATSNSIDEFEINLNDIRYKNGEISFFTRNHFTDLQWIPLNIQNGYLEEINHLVVAPTQIKMASALINFSGWVNSLKIENLVVPLATMSEKEELLIELRAEGALFPSEEAFVPYIMVNTLVAQPKLLDKIPHGAIVNFVRPNWDLTEAAGTHQNISHQGFLFRKGKILYLRHASTSLGGKVYELPFIDYLKKFVNHPTLKGVHLMRMKKS